MFLPKILNYILNIFLKDYLFLLQYSDKSVNYTSCLLIFDRTTFTPIKKFDFDFESAMNTHFFFANQKYYIFRVNQSIVEVLTIDSSLNYESVSKVFESSRVNNFNSHLRVALYNSMFTITESGPMRGSQNSTISNIIFHKASLDFESGTWEALNTNNETSFIARFSSTNITTGYLFVNSSTVNLQIMFFLNNLNLSKLSMS